jgi:hypothetical protein
MAVSPSTERDIVYMFVTALPLQGGRSCVYNVVVQIRRSLIVPSTTRVVPAMTVTQDVVGLTNRGATAVEDAVETPEHLVQPYLTGAQGQL